MSKKQRVIFEDSLNGNKGGVKQVVKPDLISFPVVDGKPTKQTARKKEKSLPAKDPNALPDVRKPAKKPQIEVISSDDASETASIGSGKMRRNVAETYRQSQRLSYDTVEYYEKMNKVLAGEAEKAMNENRDLNLRISELETKLVLVAGLIKEKELKKVAAKKTLSTDQDAERLKREEASRKKMEEERAALVIQFEKARDEMKGVLARNRELVDENEDLRSKLYHVNKEKEQKEDEDRVKEEEAVRLKQEYEDSKVETGIMVEVGCSDACVGETVETEDAEVYTDIVQLTDAQTNTTVVHTRNTATDTWALIEYEEKEVMTEKEKPPVNLQHSFIFPMLR